MKQKELSILLRITILLCGAIWLFFAHYFIRSFALSWVERDGTFLFSLIRVSLLLPVLAALLDAWHICTQIGKNNSFCRSNAMRLRRISHCALLDAGICIVLGAYTRFFLQFEQLPVSLSSPFDFYFVLLSVTLAGIVAAIAAGALSHLTLKAASIQDENDLTI